LSRLDLERLLPFCCPRNSLEGEECPVDAGAAVVADEQSFEPSGQAKLRSTTER
jgi:hypothetical protein